MWPLTVRRCARRLGFKETDEEGDWSLMWMDTAAHLDRAMHLKRFQVL